MVGVAGGQATLLQDGAAHRDGSKVSFTSAVLEQVPRVLDGRPVDYWTQQTVVDCRERTYQLGEVDGFNANGRRIAADSTADPFKPLRKGSNEAAEADDLCGVGPASLPRAAEGGLPSLLHTFRARGALTS